MKFYTNLGIVGTDGRLLISALPFSGPITFADREWFVRIKQTRSFTVSNFLIGRVTGKPSISLSYPTLNAKGQIKRVLFIALDLTWLYQTMAKAQFPRGSVLTVVDRTGTVLAHYPDPEKWIGKILPESRVIKSILAQREQGVFENVGIDHIPRLYAFCPLSERAVTGAYVSVGIPIEVAYNEANRILLLNLILLGLVTILAGAAAWWFGGFFIVHPINRLIETTRNLTNGDLTTRTNLPNKEGEIGKLSQVFDQMADTLQHRQIERDQAENDLRESEERFRSFFEHSIDAVLLTQPDGRILSANPEACRIFNRTEEEICRVGRTGVVDTTDPRLNDALEERSRTGKFKGELTFIRKDGTKFPGELSSSMFKSKDGFEKTSMIIRDITERKRMEDQLRQSREMKILGQMAAGVAHEVRNPLNAILSITEALFKEIGDNPEYQPYLDHIRNQVTRLAILMKDLLELGKPVQPESFQIEPLIEIFSSASRLWQETTDGKDHRLSVLIPTEAVRIQINTDPVKLQQVFFNLLENAGQNSPAGSEIRFTIHEHNKAWCKIRIVDAGTGIPADYIDRVFDPFFTTRKRGTGLGLSLVKGFVESIGGKVEVWNNDPPPGCTVELILTIDKGVEL